MSLKSTIKTKLFFSRKAILSIMLIFLLLTNSFIQAIGAKDLGEFSNLKSDLSNADKVELKAILTPPYVIGPGDELIITDRTLKDVFGQVETYNLNVAADGYITIPLPDGTQENILAAGYTLDEFSVHVRELFGKTLINPLVFVQISKYRPINLYIGGEVVKPGVYKVDAMSTTEPYTVTEAIQLAGGLKPRADITSIIINRGSNFEKKKVDLKEILTKGENSDLNLQPGDVIYVKASTSPDEQAQNNIPILGKLAYQEVNVNVVGRVGKPGTISLANDATILDALGRAGGVDPMGSTKKVKISRYDENGIYKTYKINLFDLIADGTTREEIALRPDDTIEIDVSKPKVATRYLRDATVNLYSIVAGGFVSGFINYTYQQKLFEFVRKESKKDQISALEAANILKPPSSNAITIINSGGNSDSE